MAAVAGALAEYVGRGLMPDSRAGVMVENGGDIFIASPVDVVVGLFAGSSELSMQLGLRIPGDRTPVGVCTSSGTIGHSLSFGVADAATVVADNTALADAAATGLGNRVTRQGRIETALEWAMTIPGIRGAVVIRGKQIGFLGDLELAPIK